MIPNSLLGTKPLWQDATAEEERVGDQLDDYKTNHRSNNKKENHQRQKNISSFFFCYFLVFPRSGPRNFFFRCF